MTTPARCLVLAAVLAAAAAIANPVAIPDTTYVLGGPGAWDGRFETEAGDPDWHGWTHADLYDDDASGHWHVSDYLPLAGQYSLWCGAWFDNACADGYGNSWHDALLFERACADTAVATVVRWQATVRVDSEPAYDYFHAQVRRGALQWEDVIEPVDGLHDLDLDVTVTIEPGDYFEGVWQLRFLATSDGAWSDEDCLWDTQGLARIDDVTVTADDTIVSSEDFESGVSVDWEPRAGTVVGDFTQLWSDLDDIDPDPEHHNDSWQVAFIDDGLVVPGTGGTPGDTWTYGPDGWAYNVTAGLQGHGVPGGAIGWSNGGVWNGVISPVLAWPEHADAGELAFDVYAHMQYFECGVTSYGWTVRATDAEDPAVLATTDWEPVRWSYFNQDAMPEGPGYYRIAVRIDWVLPPDARWVQVRLDAFEGGPWCWGWYVWDPTPAPYFDNVAVKGWAELTDTPPAPPVLSLAAAPNPFNPQVTLRFSQPAAGPVELAVFDARGRLVRRLLTEQRAAGEGRVTWDGRDDNGRGMAAGVYLARLVTTAGTERIKLTLVR